MSGRITLITLAVLAGLTYEAAAENVMVFMQSEPSGTKVFIDGSDTASGSTPCVVDVSVGNHKVKFELEDYYTEERQFTVKPSGALTVRVKLNPRRTLISIKTKPSRATVYISGEEKGRTPVRGRSVEAGEHEIRIELNGYTTIEETVTINTGTHEKLEFVLEKAEASVTEPPKDTTETKPEESSEEKPKEDAEEKKEEKPDKPPKYIEVDCWVCEGTGTLKTMGCPTCRGKGYEGLSRCAECGGTRRVDATCNACKGVGFFMRYAEQYACKICNGKGAPLCTCCRGTGKLKRLNPKVYRGTTQTCPSCSGTGREMRARCNICSGKGTRRISEGRWFSIVSCYYCKGTKVMSPACPRCQGTGILGYGTNAQSCQQCASTGQTGNKCRFCQGNGWVPAPR